MMGTPPGDCPICGCTIMQDHDTAELWGKTVHNTCVGEVL